MSQKIKDLDPKVELALESLTVTSDDVILCKGNWTQEQIQSLAYLAQKRKMDNIIIVVPDDQSIETMPIEDFMMLLKEVEKRAKGNEKENS